jgi:hypothetical protein
MAAKAHFFTHYDPQQQGNYLREHLPYWVSMGAIACCIWILERIGKDRQPR